MGKEKVTLVIPTGRLHQGGEVLTGGMIVSKLGYYGHVERAAQAPDRTPLITSPTCIKGAGFFTENKRQSWETHIAEACAGVQGNAVQTPWCGARCRFVQHIELCNASEGQPINHIMSFRISPHGLCFVSPGLSVFQLPY